jgi:hypothetical protein
MVLWSTHPLREMSTRNLLGGKGLPKRKADTTAICEPTVYKLWEPRCLTTVSAFTACYSKCHVTSNKVTSKIECAEDKFQTREVGSRA